MDLDLLDEVVIVFGYSEQQHQSFTSWLIWMLQVGALAFVEKHWLPFLMSHCWKL